MIRDVLLDRFVGFMVSNPVRSIALGGLLLYAVGHWLGWWVVAPIAAYGVADTVWCAGQIAGWWRRGK